MISLFIIFYLWSNFAFNCQLSQNEIIKIGCTTKCHNSYVSTLKHEAAKLGLIIEIFEVPSTVNSDYSSILSNYDGIISPGGHDIDPQYYSKKLDEKEKQRIFSLYKKYGNGGQGSIDPQKNLRDLHENNLMRSYFSDDKFSNMPMLGICYGMQMMAAVNDIPLYVDIKHELNIPAQRNVENEIYYSGDDMGYVKSNVKKFNAYKYHHQAVNSDYILKMPNSNLKILATSNNGKIPEIIEAKNRFAIGLQFHSEHKKQKDKSVASRYFGWMLKKACEYKKNRNHTNHSMLPYTKQGPSNIVK